MAAKPTGRFICGTHKKVIQRGSLLICLSEKCGAQAESSDKLRELAHISIQNNKPVRNIQAIAQAARAKTRDEEGDAYAYT